MSSRTAESTGASTSGLVSNPVVGLVAELCDQAHDRLAGVGTEQIGQIRARLVAPFRLAVTGKVNAGKSTLVNALLTQRVAPTAVSECTQVVSWFHYGVEERALARLSDGTTHALQFDPEGLLPQELGVAVDHVTAIDVWLSNRTLAGMTIIDTPGLAGASGASGNRTHELLGIDAGSRAAAAEADGIVFVFNQPVTADEAAVLAQFEGLGGGPGRSRASALGILSKADLVGSGQDPLGRADRLANRYRQRLGDRLLDVIPVVGLLAETVRCGRLTEAITATVAKLAAAGEDPSLLLASVQSFCDAGGPSEADDRRRLLERLGLWGIARATAGFDPANAGAVALGVELGALSGIDRVVATIDRRFRRAAPALKADRALRDLDRLGHDAGGPDGSWLRAGVERVRADPRLHRRAAIEVEDTILSRAVTLAPDVSDEALALVSDEAPAVRLGCPATMSRPDLATAALGAAQRWNSRATGAIDPAVQHIASIVGRAAQLLYRELRDE